MTFPRVVVDVTEDPDRLEGRWRVVVRFDEPYRSLPIRAFTMDAAPVTVGLAARPVPVVPVDRRADGPAAGPAERLCAGAVAEIGGLLRRLAEREASDEDVHAYGRWLHECLLGKAWSKIRSSQPVREARGVELALRWPATCTALNRLVWEAMDDGTGPLVARPDLLVAVTRIVPGREDGDDPGRPIEPVTRMPRVLFAAGSSLTDPVIRPGAMFTGLLRALDAEGVCASRAIEDASVQDLAEACRRFQPDVVQVVAHGTFDDDGRGVLLMGHQRREGAADAPAFTVDEPPLPATPVTADALAPALTAGDPPPLAAVVTACDSGTTGGTDGTAPLAAELVHRGIPIVSAMAGTVSEKACRLYTRRLMRALRDGEPVAVAAAHGRRAALIGLGAPGNQLDWAMPALYLAEAVPAGFVATDPAVTRRVAQYADGLKLRQNPVFIGRREILRLADEMFEPDGSGRVGLIAISRDGPLEGLGGTRVLQEIGFRLLRAGHIPLFLGPLKEAFPASLRAFVADVIERALLFSKKLRIEPPAVSCLYEDPHLPQAEEIAPEALSRLATADARQYVITRALGRFRAVSKPLDPLLAGFTLASDLASLADEAATLAHNGDPFGPHTRVVVLGDQAHKWEGLGPVLDLVNENGPAGLGTLDRPAPLIITGSVASDTNGARLKEFQDSVRGRPSFLFPPLEPLSATEAALGFQWVLLHPWRSDGTFREAEYVYTAARTTSPEQLQEAFRVLRGMPTAVEEMLYFVTWGLLQGGSMRADEDDVDLERYEQGRSA